MIEQQILSINKELPPTVKLVAVSKFQPLEHLKTAYRAGQRLFGENRPQEMAEKKTQMPEDVQWHFIGHLQTNKVKLVVGQATLIHSIDSRRLLAAVNNQASSLHIVQDVLLQIHIAQEETKQGFTVDEVMQVPFSDFPNVRFCGVMGMASLTDNQCQIADEFATLFHTYQELKQRFFLGDAAFCERSMGMSHDYRIAVEQGSTLVRIGSAIFPPRPQKQV